MIKKIILSGILVGVTSLNIGCSAYSTPSSTIKPPKVAMQQVNTNNDLKAVAQKFMPEGAKFLEASKIKDRKNIITLDVDHDKKEEIIVLFSIDKTFEKGFFVLKGDGDKWKKILEKKSEGNGITDVKLVNFYDDKQKSLLLGTLITGHAGVDYNIYTFKNNKVEEYNLGIWNKLDILSDVSNNNKGFIFATWVYETANILFPVDVLRFDGKEIVPAKDFYTSYYKNVAKHFEKELKENDKVQLQWYYLIDAQIKSGLPQEALKSINKVFELKKEKQQLLPVTNYKLNLFKAQALNELKKYDESEDVLSDLINEIGKQIDTIKDKGKPDYLNMELKKSLSNVYLELGKCYIGQNNKDKAQYNLNKAMSIFENISNGGYFNDSPASKIIKNSMYYNIKNEIDRIK